MHTDNTLLLLWLEIHLYCPFSVVHHFLSLIFLSPQLENEALFIKCYHNNAEAFNMQIDPLKKYNLMSSVSILIDLRGSTFHGCVDNLWHWHDP